VKKVFAVSLLVLVFFAFPKAASAATYYVSSTNGSDSNSGTLSNPFRTIQKGVDTVNGGDTLLVRGGTYVEEVKITRSGTSGNPITIKNYQNEQPIIDGEAGVACLNCGLPNGAITKYDPKTGRGHNWNPLVGIEGSSVVFEGFIVKRSIGRGIRVWKNNAQPTNIVIRGNRVEESRAEGVLTMDTSDALIENNVVTMSGSFAPWSAGRGPNILDHPGAVTSRGGNNVIIRSNTVFENWTEGIMVDTNIGMASNIVVEDNTLYDNMAVNIYVHRAQNYTVQRNLVYNTNTNPLFLAGDTNPSNCITVANEKQFTITYVTKNIDIVNNIAIGCRHNLAIWGAGEGNYQITNNVFINAVNNRADRPSYAIRFDPDGSYTNIKFENNIVYQAKTDSSHLVGRSLSTVQFANNLWYPHRPENGGGVGPGDVVGQDPQFVDPRAYILPENWTSPPSREWFKVKGSSPVINAGKVSTAFNSTTNTKVDMFLANRDSNPDIGIHEYGGNTPPTPTTPQPPCTFTGDTAPSCDGVVNLLDYQGLSNSFGGSNSDVDLSPDGIINILDYMVLSNNFGNSI